MMFTEAEAATKRCPLSFGPPLSPGGFTHAMPMGAGGYGGGFAYAQTTSPSCCIGSNCMGWRVAVPALPAFPGRVFKHFEDGREPLYETGTERAAEPEKGFCGHSGPHFGGAA